MNNENALHLIIDSIPNSTTNYIDVLSALLVPVIAIVGSVIAYQQYKINQQRLKHELYERRLAIFKLIKTYLSKIYETGKVTRYEAMQFMYDVAESTFLLDESINSKIETIYTKSMRMALLQEKIYPADGSRGLPSGEERSRVTQENMELLKWLGDQLVELKPLFNKHLKLKF